METASVKQKEQADTRVITKEYEIWKKERGYEEETLKQSLTKAKS